jgi:acyl-CoA synthetase (AMP-forming)/AMP-acid ligase II
VVENARSHTFSELHATSVRLASALASRGVAAGATVGVALHDGFEHIAALYALLALGAVILPLSPNDTPHELSATLRFYDARWLLAPGPTTLELGATVLDLPALLAQTNTASEAAECATEPDAPALITNSSGTTGVAKGALWTQRMLTSRFAMQAELLSLGADQRYGVVVPLFHSGSRNGALSTLYCGGSVAFLPRHHPAQLPELTEHFALTVLYLVPQSLELVARGPGRGRLGRLSALYSTSDRLTSKVRATLREALTPRVYDAYVTSEAGYISCFRPEDPIEHDDSVGRPLPGVELEIVDEAGKPVPMGELGEIRTRGPTTPHAYHRNDSATAIAFRDGWFYPGDRGRLDGAGFLELRGRTRQQFARAGIKVFPQEIEAVAMNHPAVEDAAAVSPQGAGEQPIVLFFTTSRPVSPAELGAFIAERLSSRKRPDRLVRVAALPRGALGKVRRDELAREAERMFGAAR